MNASKPLISTVDEIATAAKAAITAGAAEETDAHTLSDCPALNTGADGIYASDHFVVWEARPGDGKEALGRASVRVANSTSLHANPHLTVTGINQRFHYGRELSGFRDLDCSVHFAHVPALSSIVRA